MLKEKGLPTQVLIPSESGNKNNSIDWHTVYVVVSAVVVSIASLYASYSTFEIAQSYGLAIAYTATWLHLPITYFSSLYVIWMAKQHPIMAWLGTVSAVLNALLVVGGAV